MFPGVPFMFKMLSETRFSRPPSFASLRLTMSAGAPLPEAVAQRFQERFSIPISQQYGCTEVGTIAVNTQSPVAKPTSVGLPIPGCQLEVRDESGRVVPAGELGEVWVKSRTMATCYDSAADATSKSFRDGFFCAGDQGYVDDQGLLFVTGRKNLVINVGGFKVDPSEVEQVLRKHPSVQDVVVLGVTHPQYGEQLKAAVVPNPQALCSADDLRAFAEGQLVDYKVPTLIEFIREIPTSPVGKILRKYLAESH
jgi:long-chain acyl-CoA synthetase